jgi:hypothetical protein
MRKVDGGGGAVGGDLHEKQREVRWPTTGVHGGRREVSFGPAVGTRTRVTGSTLSGRPGGDGVLTSGPGAEREADRWGTVTDFILN